MKEFGEVIYVGLCALKRVRWRKLAREVVEIKSLWIESCWKSMFSMRTAGEKDIRKNADLQERDHLFLHTSLEANKPTAFGGDACFYFSVMRCRTIRVHEHE